MVANCYKLWLHDFKLLPHGLSDNFVESVTFLHVLLFFSVVEDVLLLPFNNRLENLLACVLPPSGPEELPPLCLLYCRKKRV